MEKIGFSTNWNKKLNCDYFTTLRLANPKKYEVGKTYQIELNEKPIFLAQIVEIKTLKMYDLTPFQCALDTGYNKPETMQIIRNIYKNKVQNIENHFFNLILLQKIEK